MIDARRGQPTRTSPWRWIAVRALLCGLLSAAAQAADLGVSATHGPQRSQADGRVAFANRTAADVLQAYERLGFAFIYSSDVLPVQRRFSVEPMPGAPIARLRQALLTMGVTLRVADHNRRWLIVPAPRGTDEGEPHVAASPPIVPSARPALPLEELVVVGSRYAMSREASGVAELDALQLEALPELGDDSLRAVNHLPGVASLGLSARPHIRGGDVDESLVLLDGMELLAPYHLRSFNSVFSGLHPGTIDSIDVYTGAFPARYGGRMGAVLDISTRTELPDTGAEFALSPFTTAAVVFGTRVTTDRTADPEDMAEGTSPTLPADSRQWLVAARRGNLSEVARAVDPSVGAPDYADGYAEVRWARDMSGLAVGALAHSDDTRLREFSDDRRGAGLQADDDNRYAWTRLTMGTDAWRGVTHLYVTDVQHARQGIVNDDDADESVGLLDERLRFRRWSLEQSLTRSTLPAEQAADQGADTLALGFVLRHESALHRIASSVERGDISILLGVPGEQTIADRIALERASFSAWGSVRTAWTPELTTELGVRVDAERYPGDGPDDMGISPRASLRYDLGPRTQLRAAAGRFRQPHGLHELQVADGEQRLQRAQETDHLVLGFEHRFTTWNTQLRGEMFMKRVAHPKRRYENLFDALQLVPELGPDRIRIESEEARARGMELQLSVQPTSEFGAWLSYSNARSEDRVLGAWTPRTWDQRHTVQLGALWTPAHWTVSAGVTWHNGWRTTRLSERIDELAPQRLRRNASPLPDYLSIDARVSRMWASERQSFILFAEVTNLTNHHNVGATNVGLEDEDDEARPLMLDLERERMVPLVPSIGFVWRFQ